MSREEHATDGFDDSAISNLSSSYRVPSTNVEIALLLFRLEVGLRELIIEVLEEKRGPHWFTQCMKEKFQRFCRRYEMEARDAKWAHFIRYHPLYYSNFEDLTDILMRSDLIEDCWVPIFGRDTFFDTLKSLEPIRNRVAHNRRVTDNDLHTTRGVYAQVETAVGRERLEALIDRSTTADDAEQMLRQLREDAHHLYEECRTCKVVRDLGIWPRIKEAWWFDDGYVQADLKPIREFFESTSRYSNLPRGRGMGHKIEAWVRRESIDERYASAERALAELLRTPSPGHER